MHGVSGSHPERPVRATESPSHSGTTPAARSTELTPVRTRPRDTVDRSTQTEPAAAQGLAAGGSLRSASSRATPIPTTIHATDVPRNAYPSKEQTLSAYTQAMNEPGRSQLSNMWGFRWMKKIPGPNVTTAQTNTMVGSLGPAVARAAAVGVGPTSVALGAANTVAAALATQLAPDVGKAAATRLVASTAAERQKVVEGTPAAMSAFDRLNLTTPGLGGHVAAYGRDRATNLVQAEYPAGHSPAEFNRDLMAPPGETAITIDPIPPTRRERMSVAQLDEHRSNGWSPNGLSPSELAMHEKIGALAAVKADPNEQLSVDGAQLVKSAKILDKHAFDVAQPIERQYYDAAVKAVPELPTDLPHTP